MPSPHPVILCGKTEATGAVVIEDLKPESEVVYFVQTVEAGKQQIPALLLGGDPGQLGSNIGSSNYEKTPVAVSSSAAFNDEDVKELCETDKGTKEVPWLRADTTKLMPPPVPEYGKAMVARIKETLWELEERNRLDGDGDV